MNIMRTSRIALRALARNKMRSFLTALGIIIGVGAVIAMVSLGEGAKRGVEERFNAMGTNLLFVRAGSRSSHGVRGGAGTFQRLTPEDAAAIEQQCSAVKYTSPSVNSNGQIVYGNKNWNTQISGTGAAYPEIRAWELETGTFFDEAQVRAAGKVCVLGTEVKKNLFEDEDPVGKIVRIKGIPFRVLGVLKAKGSSGGFFNQDDMITVPYTTVMKRLSRSRYLQSIDVQAVSADKTSEAQTQIEELMRIRHKLAPGAEDDFSVNNMTEIAEGAAQSTQIMGILLGSIASISLLVGGIGIMNIMLVSVTERIREIGIRMAVGAKEKDILLQFLTEAVVLSVLGGGLGVLFGIGSSKLMKFIPIFSTWKTVVSPMAILLAFAFSASVGIFFGFYPARKASKLDPIEALRYE
ncbi:MAG: ABC transporter permease [Candidatus Aminicenantales bacterium]